jgi:hypothetical protein
VSVLLLVFTALSPAPVRNASTNLFMKILFFKLANRLSLATLLHLLLKSFEVQTLCLKLGLEDKSNLLFFCW